MGYKNHKKSIKILKIGFMAIKIVKNQRILVQGQKIVIKFHFNLSDISLKNHFPISWCQILFV